MDSQTAARLIAAARAALAELETIDAVAAWRPASLPHTLHQLRVAIAQAEALQ